MSYADDMNATPLNKLPPPVVQSKHDMGSTAPPNYKDLLTNMDVNAGGPPVSRAQQMMMMQQQDEPEEYYPQQQQQQPQQMMYGPPPPGMFPGYNTYNSYDPPPQQPRHEPSHRSSKKPKSALKDKSGGGVMGFLKTHKNVLIVAIVAFLAMRYLAPRLRAFPMMLSPMGGLSAPGMAVVAIIIGASTKVTDYV